MPEHHPTSLSEQDQLPLEQDIVEVITDAWSQDLTDLWFGAEQYLTALTTGNIPPDPNAAGDFMRRVTQSEEITPSILGCCVHIARQIIEQTHEIAMHQGETTGQPDYGPILVPLSEVDEQTLQAMLESETFSIDTEYALEHTSGQTIAIGRILTKVYGNVSMLDLADPDNKAFNDPLATELRSRPDFIAAVASELHRSEPWREGTPPRDIAYLKRFWADRFLQYVGNMPSKLRYGLSFDSISRTAAAKDPSNIDDASLESLLIRAATNLRVIGVDNALLLNEKAGIVSFDYYDADQLRLTALFAAGDRETIEHLQAGDVTVVFTNTKGDYSGALSNTAHAFRTPNSRTLFFEIANLEDAIGYLELLRQNGVRPSTFVYSDHGLPDGFDARLSGKNVRVTHNTLAGPTLSGAPRVGLQDFPHISQIVEQYMQASRGIDDPHEAIGTRRIIMAACHLAKKVDITRRRYSHEPSEIESQNGVVASHESLIESLVRIINRTGVIIYGGDRPIQIHRRYEALHLYDSMDTSDKIVALPITRVYIDGCGNVVTETVMKLQLSRQPSEGHQT